MAKRHTEPPDLRFQHGRLRWARERAQFASARAAAIAFGWNENTYKSHEGGIRQGEGLKEKHLERYARAFKVNQGWLATGKGDPSNPDLTPEELATLRKLLRAAEGQ